MNRVPTSYSKLKNVLDNPNEKITPRVSIYDFDVSQKIVESQNYMPLKSMCVPKDWRKTAGTFL